MRQKTTILTPFACVGHAGIWSLKTTRPMAEVLGGTLLDHQANVFEVGHTLELHIVEGSDAGDHTGPDVFGRAVVYAVTHGPTGRGKVQLALLAEPIQPGAVAAAKQAA